MKNKTLIYGAALVMLAVGSVPAKAEMSVTHNIRPGESLYRIAINNRCTVNDLKQANGLTGDLIYAGNKLALPVESKSQTASAPVGNSDMTILARLVNAEAGGESFQGKVAVAAVIMNRMNDAKFPATIAGNVFKPHEFESVSNGQIWKEPTPECFKAAEAALKGWDPTGGAKFFYNPAKINGPSWVWTRTVIDRIGQHVFAL